MDRALTRCRYALAISIMAFLLALGVGGFWPVILSEAVMALLCIGCLVLQVILLVRGRPGERYQRR